MNKTLTEKIEEIIGRVAFVDSIGNANVGELRKELEHEAQALTKLFQEEREEAKKEGARDLEAMKREAEILGKYANYLKSRITDGTNYSDFGRWSQQFRKGNNDSDSPKPLTK